MNSDLLKNDETLDDLQLKGLYIIQKRDTFRFGVDAILLANFARIKRGDKVVDLCSGTGIVPFVLVGKKLPSKIVGIEIQKDMVEMSIRSTRLNNVGNIIEFINEDLRNLNYLKSISKVDVVTVNPPYKLKNSGIVNLRDKDAIARHEICCELEDVIKASKTVLKDNGRMYMIHRPDRMADIICTMRQYKIEPKFIRMVQPNINKAPNMMLIEAQNNGGRFLKWGVPIYVHQLDGSYTEEINRIYGR